MNKFIGSALIVIGSSLFVYEVSEIIKLIYNIGKRDAYKEITEDLREIVIEVRESK